MAKTSQEMLDAVIKRFQGSNDIPHIVRIGAGSPPVAEEDLPRYEAARKVTEVYYKLQAKVTFWGCFRLSMRATEFYKKYPNG